ncbi:MAG: MBL fold metallo-hydrolase [Woeseia sp.]
MRNRLCTLLLIGALSVGTSASAQCERCRTDEEVLRWNPNSSREHQLAPWPGHRIIDNVYYVGTRNLASFLIATSAGHILINSNDEQTLPLIRKSVEELGFEWTDIGIVLGSHAHADHMSANATIKGQTGALLMAMREDIPLLAEMTPGSRSPPVDRVLRHRDTITLGGETLTAHLTAGHTPGTTTWTLEAEEDGTEYDVVFLGGATATPRTDVTSTDIQKQFQEAFIVLRGLSCDVPLGPHAPIHHMEEKFRLLEKGEGPNPYIDPQGCQDELSLSERVFYLLLGKQLGTQRT